MSDLNHLLDSEAPLSQVKEFREPEDGWYNHTIEGVDLTRDQNSGIVYIEASLRSHASDTPGEREFTRKWRLFYGTQDDPEAALPETKLNSSGLAQLKGWARVNEVPANTQQLRAFFAALRGKRFCARIYQREDKKTQKKYTTLGKNPVKVGAMPAKLDSATASTTDATATGYVNGRSTMPEGVTFGTFGDN